MTSQEKDRSTRTQEVPAAAVPTPSTQQLVANEELPLFLLEETVVFPKTLTHLVIKRSKALQCIKEAYHEGTALALLAPKKKTSKHPTLKQLHSIGTTARVERMLELPEGHTVIILAGEERFRILGLTGKKEPMIARIQRLEPTPLDATKPAVQALLAAIREAALSLIALTPQAPRNTPASLQEGQEPSVLLDYASTLITEHAHRQKLLETLPAKKQAQLLLKYLTLKQQFLQFKRQIEHKVHKDLIGQQRDHLLQEQIKALQSQLSQPPEAHESLLKKLEARGRKMAWTPAAQKQFDQTLTQLQQLPEHTPEYSHLVSYLHHLMELPWKRYTKDTHDIPQAAIDLDKDHYGMEKVKERILEYLAVHQHTGQVKGPILCLYGPPGIGKTSLCASIAQTLGRKYVKMSLGGLHDEAQLRGHRKTYVGAMPGRVMTQAQPTPSSSLTRSTSSITGGATQQQPC